MSRNSGSSCSSSAMTSRRDSTAGRCSGRRARSRPCSSGIGKSRTRRYRKSTAQRAWFCVDAAVCRSTARWLMKAVMSGPPSLRGCRPWWKAMKARIQWR
jgi:hypothetical protein